MSQRKRWLRRALVLQYSYIWIIKHFTQRFGHSPSSAKDPTSLLAGPTELVGPQGSCTVNLVCSILSCSTLLIFPAPSPNTSISAGFPLVPPFQSSLPFTPPFLEARAVLTFSLSSSLGQTQSLRSRSQGPDPSIHGSDGPFSHLFLSFSS